MKTTIQLSDCYAIHIQINRALNTTARHLQITSTFSGAKDPGGHQKILDMTLSEDQHKLLVEAVKGDGRRSPEARPGVGQEPA